MENIEEAQQVLSETKMRLMADPTEVFIISVLLRLRCELTEDVPTAAVDGTTLFLNPDFFLNQCTREQRVFVLLHETWHVAFRHCTDMGRKQDRNPLKWNYAGDYVINWMLHTQGREMFDWVLLDKQYADMSTEAVYAVLPDKKRDSRLNDVKPAQDPEKSSQELDGILVQATIAAEKAASANMPPTEILRYIDKLRNPTLHWKQLLTKYFSKIQYKGLNYSKSKRRYLPKFHLPTQRKEKSGNLTIALDVSGSVSQEDLTQFVSDVFAIFKQSKVKTLTVLQFDHMIEARNEFNSLSDLQDLRFIGGGGTQIQSVFKEIQEEKQKPDVLVVFTDGQFADKRYTPTADYPVIWVIKNNLNFRSTLGVTKHV